MDLSELERLENPAKVLKLSEAMRIGSRIRPMQTARSYYLGEIASCALGAAYEGAGRDIHACCVEALMEVFGPLQSVMCEVANRNDAGESREEIADCLESEGY